MAKNFVSKMLTLGADRVDCGFTLSELYKKINYSTDDDNKLKNTIAEFLSQNFSSDENEMPEKWYITPDGYSRYLQYKDIKTAKSNSLIAIIISIFLSFSSIMFSIFYTNSIKINNNQIEQLIKPANEINHNLNNLSGNLDSINLNILKVYFILDSVRFPKPLEEMKNPLKIVKSK